MSKIAKKGFFDINMGMPEIQCSKSAKSPPMMSKSTYSKGILDRKVSGILDDCHVHTNGGSGLGSRPKPPPVASLAPPPPVAAVVDNDNSSVEEVPKHKENFEEDDGTVRNANSNGDDTKGDITPESWRKVVKQMERDASLEIMNEANDLLTVPPVGDGPGPHHHKHDSDGEEDGKHDADDGLEHQSKNKKHMTKNAYSLANEFAMQSGYMAAGRCEDTQRANAKMEFTRDNLHNKFFIVCDSLGEQDFAPLQLARNRAEDTILGALGKSMQQRIIKVESSSGVVELKTHEQHVHAMCHTQSLLHWRVQAIQMCQLEDLYKRVLKNKSYRLTQHGQLLLQQRVAINPLLCEHRTNKFD